MSTKISIERKSGLFHMEASNETGNTLHMDGSAKIGGENKGVRPMEALLMALGGCSSIDVISILNKMKSNPDSFKVELEGEREEGVEPSLYRNILIKFICEGDIDPQKIHKAVNLSLEKYCSVAKTLEPTCKISSEIILNGNKV